MHITIQAVNYAIAKVSTSGAKALAIADLNKDGYLDIVTANSDSSVSILFGNSAGAFYTSTNSVYSLGAYPSSVAIADLNKDGNLDIVTSNYNSISVLLGNSVGTFALSTNFPYSGGISSVAIADLNRDGYLDIVIADRNSIPVLLGNSVGTFVPSPKPTYNDGNIYSIVIADLNKDGYLDIVTANADRNSVSVLLGENSVRKPLSFHQEAYPVGAYPNSVAIADLNKDGNLDIVAANYAGNSVSVLLGSPGGKFLSSSGTYSVGKNPYSVAIADLNKDGNLDIVTANSADNSVSMLIGNSVGTFAPSPNSPYSVGINPRSVAVADLNQDGYLDIVTANDNANSVSVLLGNSVGAFAPSPNPPYVIGKGPYPVAIADFNKDGNLDIVIANYNANSVSMLLGNSVGAFSPSPNSPCSVSMLPYSIAIADLNKDGNLDIVTANYGTNSVSVLIGNSVGTFAPSPNSPYAVATGPTSVAVADLNKDGYLDIVTANYGANSISVLLGNSVGTFAPSPNSPYSISTNPISIAVADLNKDGNLDIVTANYGSNSVSILFGSFGKAFSPSTNSLYVVGKNPYSVAIADLNKDGNLDIVTANYADDSVSVLLGGSGGAFSPSPNSPHSVDANPISIAIADLNKDGNLDIVTTHYGNNSVSVLLGRPEGAFSPSPNSPYYGFKNPSSVAIADLNKDGNLDLVVTNAGSGEVSVVFGTIDGPFSQSIEEFIDQKLGGSYKCESVYASGSWPWLQPAIQTAFFAIGLSMFYLLKQQLDALAVSTRQSIQQLNARLDAGAALESKLSPESELPYTTPVTQDLPGAKLAGDDGAEAQAVVPA